MANEIKLDMLVNATTTLKHTRKELAHAAHPAKEDGMTVSSQLGALATTLSAEHHIPDNQQRVHELKEKIANNQYHVDIDQLAAKLAHTFINTK